MATSYPEALDNFTNPTSTTSVGALSHAAQHAAANDAIEAIQLKLGINSSSDSQSIDNILTTLKNFVDNITTADVAEDVANRYFTNDRAYDAIKLALDGGSHVNIEFTYDDATRTYNLSTTADVITESELTTTLLDYVTNSSLTQQKGSANGIATLDENAKVPDSQISSTIARDSELTAGVADAKSYADTQDAIVLSGANQFATEKADLAVEAATGQAEIYTDTQISTLLASEVFENQIKDSAAEIITGGTHTGITVSYDNTNNLLSLTATYDDQEVIDAIATALTAGTGLTKVYSETPANYIGDYDNGYSYVINDVVSIPTGSPYGIVGSYFIRTGNPSNPGYPPEPGGAPNASWTLYNFAPTITVSVNTSVIATQEYVNTSISNLVDGAPALLDTLNEIAAAIGDDSNFVTTITTALSTKLSIVDAASTYLSLSAADERIQDSAAALFTHAGHSNVTATYDDVNNKINLAVTAQLTQEQAQDYIAPLFTHGQNPNIIATYDDLNNNLILETVIPPSKAIMSASAPASPADGAFWFDTDEFRTGTTKALKVWSASSSTWEYVSSNLSLSTTNTWTSKNTYTNGIIIGLGAPPVDPVHGQIYYNTVLDKLKVWDGLLWQDIQGSGGGGGLALTPTDLTAPASTFFVGLIAPPSGATSDGDLWIDVDDTDTPFNQFYTGGVAPDPQQYEFWVDNVEPIQELIYSADEPSTPSYEGELWIDTDEFDGSILEFGATPPNPDNVQLWVDINENESPSYYDQLTFTNYPTSSDFPPNAPNGFIAADASTGAAFVRTQGNWLKIVTASNINETIRTNSSIFEELKAIAWMGFE